MRRGPRRQRASRDVGTTISTGWLGLKRLPAVLVDYVMDESITVDVWPSCGLSSITKEEVIKKCMSPSVYPPKTTRHRFVDVSACFVEARKAGAPLFPRPSSTSRNPSPSRGPAARMSARALAICVRLPILPLKPTKIASPTRRKHGVSTVHLRGS